MNITELLQKLISIRSVYPDEQEISAYIVTYLQKIGFEVTTVTTGNDRNNIVATFGKSDLYLGFYGHMDTVPPDSAYSQDPFSMWVEDGNIARGLGVCDMKGGLSAILKIAEYAVGKNLPVKLIFGVDEEDISQGAHDLVDSCLLKDISYLLQKADK
jgi:acetylornithine deacetylase/succinyl-diaminopimelate desuccinylase-like protein